MPDVQLVPETNGHHPCYGKEIEAWKDRNSWSKVPAIEDGRVGEDRGKGGGRDVDLLCPRLSCLFWGRG